MSSAINDLLIGAFWAAVRDRLDTPTMRQILGAPAAPDPRRRLYVTGIDSYAADEAGAGTDWGRGVIVPVQTLWPVAEVEGETRKLAFLWVVEFNPLAADGYNPMVGLELAQREGYRRLSGWTPGALSEVFVVMPLYRTRAPQPIPQRDDERGLLYLSSEYRTEVGGVA